ncbi:O-methyltransferase [Maricaulis sp. D1M11]|uniref:O-methyltransferase n=1 Tax=Maricaulis sp. D1M11 TaxID=3076117 RepID=UPI0039B496B7
MSHSIGLNETLTAYVQAANRDETAALKACREDTMAMGDVANMQISPEQGAFLQICARMVRARIAVEIGVFTGYSALATILAMKDMHGSDARLFGCDISREYTDQARTYWAQAGVDDQIELTLGDARETLCALAPSIVGEVDMIFIDADKTGYDAYYEAGLDLLRPGGVILFDNVLWNGDVADPAKVMADADTAALRSIAETVKADPRVDMAFTGLGDGILMAVKR